MLFGKRITPMIRASEFDLSGTNGNYDLLSIGRDNSIYVYKFTRKKYQVIKFWLLAVQQNCVGLGLVIFTAGNMSWHLFYALMRFYMSKWMAGAFCSWMAILKNSCLQNVLTFISIFYGLIFYNCLNLKQKKSALSGIPIFFRHIEKITIEELQWFFRYLRRHRNLSKMLAYLNRSSVTIKPIITKEESHISIVQFD